MWLAKIEVTPKAGVLDPQGKAVRSGLAALGFGGVHEVRVGRFLEVWLDVADQSEAARVADEACRKLLANPVIEEYRVTVEEAQG